MDLKRDTVKIVPSVLKEQVDNGWKRKDLATHYGLPETQMAAALKQLGLKIRKKHFPKFEIVTEDTVVDISYAVTDDIKVEEDATTSNAW